MFTWTAADRSVDRCPSASVHAGSEAFFLWGPPPSGTFAGQFFFVRSPLLSRRYLKGTAFPAGIAGGEPASDCARPQVFHAPVGTPRLISPTAIATTPRTCGADRTATTCDGWPSRCKANACKPVRPAARVVARLNVNKRRLVVEGMKRIIREACGGPRRATRRIE
jgi:hypothetical protein